MALQLQECSHADNTNQAFSDGEAVGLESSADVFRRSSADLPRIFRGASETTSGAGEKTRS